MNAIKKIELSSIDTVLPLFQEFRRFNRKNNDPSEKKFLENRIQNNEAVLIAFMEGNSALGYIQFCFTYSPVNLTKVAIITDLYVSEKFRRKKVGTQLVEASINEARRLGCESMQISALIANTNAQALIKKYFKKDNDLFYFNMSV